MCPLIKELENNPKIKSFVCVTAQHRQMLDQVLEAFQITPDYDLNLMKESQTLFDITSRVLMGIGDVIKKCNPDIVLVHGDTTTSFAAALAAFYCMVPVGHVEAGLRTWDKYSPYPEEMNRTLTGDIAELHFSPTKQNMQNLKNENINNNIYITGNTVIDAFKTTVIPDYVYENKQLSQIDFLGKKVVLLTAHRRENLGKPLEQICKAVKRIAEEYKELSIVYPVHLNPAVRKTVFDILDGQERIHLIDPLNVMDMHNLMSKSFLVLTDSGGLQEEAPYFGIPVLVLRTETERPEAVEMGTVKVVGVEEDAIVLNVKNLIDNQIEYDKMAKSVNPYGDGHASERIADALLNWYQSTRS